MIKKTNNEAGEIVASTFSKEELLKSRKYQKRRDLLTVLLKAGRQYSHSEVKALIGEFMKGGVK